jgi:antitoxin (DNA-binding transcriptional repressor) of toxin-antitoxin stability system
VQVADRADHRADGRASWKVGVAERSRLAKAARTTYFQAMRAVSLKALKAKLDEYVRLASGGETVLVTERGRVIAQLVPPGATRGKALAGARLADAVRRGWITPPARPDSGPPPRRPVMSFQELIRDLRQERDDR